MLWFGESWHAPVCSDPAEQVPTPVGARCLQCEVVIREGERGVVLSRVSGNPLNPTVRPAPLHIVCLVQGFQRTPDAFAPSRRRT